jgi:hypothetical protein
LEKGYNLMKKSYLIGLALETAGGAQRMLFGSGGATVKP